MEFKYVKNISKAGLATVHLYGTIGVDVIGRDFATEIVNIQDLATSIELHVNSVGGSVVDGWEIVSAIRDSKVPVNIHIDGLAASIASVIALSGDKRYMKDFATIMIHNPSGGDKKILDVVKAQLIKILTDRSKLSADEISSLMNNETYFNSDEAMASGLVDDIELSNYKSKINIDRSDLYNMMKVYNKLNIPEMKDVKNKLGLDSSVEESVVVESITKLQNEINELKESIASAKKENDVLIEEKTSLAEKVTAFETEKVEAKRTEIENMVNAFVEAGKITAEEKPSYVKLATFDYETTKNALDKIGIKVPAKIINSITISDPSTLTDVRKDWTFRDWETKDEAGLKELKNKAPELFSKLYDAQYGQYK